ncbi:hypothetical protein D7243_20670 [Stutzerimonas stutzeri]|nr:hypothetical protein [Stutzerimonas stutzeri]
MASFLAWYAGTLTERRLSDARFRLPMSRVQIANHLGLAVELVSRALAELRAEASSKQRGGRSRSSIHVGYGKWHAACNSGAQHASLRDGFPQMSLQPVE